MEATRLGDIVRDNQPMAIILCIHGGEIAARGMQPSRNAKISKKVPIFEAENT